MAQYGYSIKDMNETRVRSVMRDVPMSYKTAVMIGRRIKGMPAAKAILFLQNVQKLAIAVPYTTFNDSVGHKPGSMGPGRYPVKAAQLFEMLIKSAVANAEDKGLGKEVSVEFVVGQRASQPWHHGRQGRRKFKRSHVEVVLTNMPVGKEAKKLAKNTARKTKPTKTETKETKTEKQ